MLCIVIVKMSVPRRHRRRHTIIVEDALASNPVNIEEIRRQARGYGGGLVNNQCRSDAWLRLLAIDPTWNGFEHRKFIHKHKETDQVAVDVARSLWRMPSGISKSQRRSMRKQLSNCINAVLCIRNDTHYYQGLHEICSVLLIVTQNERLSFLMLSALVQCHIYGFTRKTMQSTMHQLDFVFALLNEESPELVDHFLRSGIEQPHFAVSWILTWFCHVLEDLSIITRLFDFFLASHPLMPCYLSAVLLKMNRDILLATPCEYSQLHK